MTQCDQSWKEVTLQRPSLSSMKTTRTGTWNVRAMYKAGRTAQIVRKARSYNITVLGLCQTRWLQSGQVRLQTGETVLYLGHEHDNAPHTEGVALMLSPEAKCSLISWEAAGPRIIHVSVIFKTEKQKMKLNIVECCAPTNDSNDKTKEYFQR